MEETMKEVVEAFADDTRFEDVCVNWYDEDQQAIGVIPPAGDNMDVVEIEEISAFMMERGMVAGIAILDTAEIQYRRV